MAKDQAQGAVILAVSLISVLLQVYVIFFWVGLLEIDDQPVAYRMVPQYKGVAH